MKPLDFCDTQNLLFVIAYISAFWFSFNYDKHPINKKQLFTEKKKERKKERNSRVAY